MFEVFAKGELFFSLFKQLPTHSLAIYPLNKNTLNYSQPKLLKRHQSTKWRQNVNLSFCFASLLTLCVILGNNFVYDLIRLLAVHLVIKKFQYVGGNHFGAVHFVNVIITFQNKLAAMDR